MGLCAESLNCVILVTGTGIRGRCQSSPGREESKIAHDTQRAGPSPSLRDKPHERRVYEHFMRVLFEIYSLSYPMIWSSIFKKG